MYAVQTAAGWQVRFTVDWETDIAYWLDRGYRDGVAEVWGSAGAVTVDVDIRGRMSQADNLGREGSNEGGRREGGGGKRRGMGETKTLYRKDVELKTDEMSEMAQMIIRLERQMPLGEAEEGCRRVQAKLGAGGKLPNADVVETLLIRTFAEKRQDSLIAKYTGWERFAPPQKTATPLDDDLLKPWRTHDPLEADARIQCVRLRPQAPGRMSMRADAKLQAIRLTAVLSLFEGRSLLQAEAAAMLAEHASGIAAGVGLPSLLQLGALLGTLRLTAAVASAEPRGRRQRCRRCGSGEAALRRTACASCGSASCAVCEACLALGRSRACGLLVRGRAPAASPLRAAGVAGPTAADICARWGLSPAQRAASEQAVRFLLAAGERAAGTAAGARLLSRVSALFRRGNRWATAGTSPSDGRRVAASPPSVDQRSGYSSFHSADRQGTLASPPPANRQITTLIPSRVNHPNGTPTSFAADLPRGDPLAVQPRSFLLWAVTGAGKTEMVFPLLDAVMSAGGRALLATPRRDVVLELAPRLAKAFPERSIAVLYGGSGNRWQQAELTLATTHQLMRFGQAFDLVLIDELDAFPYHGDPMLHYAAAASRKPDGVTMLLSATPPPTLRRAVRSGKLPCAKVPVRYHRHPLPVPKIMNLPPLSRWIGSASARRPRYVAGFADRQAVALFERLGASLARGAQVFVFVPVIRQIEPLVALFRRQADRWRIPPAAIDGTSSQDEGRRDKVTAFRDRELRLLVTTTILERGVTVPRSDVFILDAHAKLFDEAALVQMAGRAGRSADDPGGRVYFFAAHRTKSVTGAIRQISAMNRLARRGGYLLASARGQRVQRRQPTGRVGLHEPPSGQGIRR